jgi:hypothetical protein
VVRRQLPHAGLDGVGALPRPEEVQVERNRVRADLGVGRDHGLHARYHPRVEQRRKPARRTVPCRDVAELRARRVPHRHGVRVVRIARVALQQSFLPGRDAPVIVPDADDLAPPAATARKSGTAQECTGMGAPK